MTYLCAMIMFLAAAFNGSHPSRFWPLLAAAGFWALIAIGEEIRDLRKSGEKVR